MTGGTGARRLAVFYDQHSESVLHIYQAARPWCRILWIVGWLPGEPDYRGLSRFGDVVDVSGASEAEVVRRVAALQPEGVVVFDDLPIRIAALLAEKLGLRFHDSRSARLLTDKVAQRAALRDAGVPVPAFAPVGRGDVNTAVPFPAVLKPRRGAGSRDTFAVASASEVAAALDVCDPSEEFVLEQWLPDRPGGDRCTSDVVSVESIVRDGDTVHVALTGRFPFAPPFRETGSFLSCDLEADERSEVTELAAIASRALGLRHGVLHTEIKLTPSGARVIEVNGRLGGGIGQMIERVGGPSLRSWAVQLALGLDVGEIPTLGSSPVAFFRWIVPPPSARRLLSVAGVEEVAALPGVDAVRVNLRAGDSLDPRHSSQVGHVVRIDGCVNSHEELYRLVHEQISSVLRVEWESGG